LPSVSAQEGRVGPPLTPVCKFGDDFRLVGIGVSHRGRLFATAPSSRGRSRYSMVEVDPKTCAMSPYPDVNWNNFRADPGSEPEWISVQALWDDDADHLWALDSSLTSADQERLPPKLVEFDLATNQAIHIYTFKGVITPKDSINDVRVDAARGYAYITNAANQGGLIVLNLRTGQSRMVLAGDRSAVADPKQHLMLNGQPARWPDGSVAVIQADGIALSPDGDWLYYRPVTDHNYWRIQTAALRDERLSAADLARKVEFLGTSVISGGLIMDRQPVLYAGNLDDHSVMALTPEPGGHGLKERVFVRDPAQLAWADGFAISGNDLYISDSHLNEIGFLNHLPRTGPFTIFRVPLPAQN
jgi:sugar lactone lactonase YvrE